MSRILISMLLSMTVLSARCETLCDSTTSHSALPSPQMEVSLPIAAPLPPASLAASETDIPEADFSALFIEEQTINPEAPWTPGRRLKHESIYRHPASLTYRCPDWKRMWTNTAVLGGAFIGTLVVLECLPEDATSWNRAEIQSVPMFKRWRNHVLREGPAWDHDKAIFNYVLHPYAGAVYFMSARSCGFNFWQSLLYSTCISSIGWEFGIEAFMERPSIQDLFVTPLVGSIIGEGFYRAKRRIAENDYHLLGSKVLGNIVVFLIDPVNEVIDLFRGRNTSCSRANHQLSGSFSPMITPNYKGFSLCMTF